MPGTPDRIASLIQLSLSDPFGTLSYGALRLPCALGPSGTRALKREGDGATPRGLWPLRRALYRADRLCKPITCLPIRQLRASDGWCDSANDPNYNRPVRLPYSASAEALWRSDDLYNLIVVLGFNDWPRRRGHGSAIFMHVAREDFAPTAGCIALRQHDLLQLLAAPKPPRWIRIGAGVV